MTNKDLKQRYKFYNRKYFENKLPNITVKFSSKSDHLPKRYLGGSKWRRQLGKKGEYYKILIAKQYGKVIAYQTLLHEMIHVKLGAKYNHGPKFRKEIKRLFKAGAYYNLL